MSDTLANRIFLSLIKDFRRFEGANFAEGALQAYLSGIQSYRDYEFPALGHVSAFRFKAYRQLANLFKRYRFNSDAYTDLQLEERTYSSYVTFHSEQAVLRPRKTVTQNVLREARRICRTILSLTYEPEKYRKLGRRAEYGCSLRDAFMDSKMTPAFFTCPTALKLDFWEEVKRDPHLKRIARRLTRKGNCNFKADSLRLTPVPKSWKTHRSITPLSTYGLYWSYGIGGYVEECLRHHGLDIKLLQETHKTLAREFSKTRTHVTADLTMASESCQSWLLNAVLPRFLYTDLKKTFVRNVEIQGIVHQTTGVLPMGNAATFPVETLLFYCLIKAIGNLSRVKGGVYSAYGDDLIYPRRIHRFVPTVFADLGIRLNMEKTCCESNFRESCGGDYYRGIDVRPFLFPDGCMPTSGRLAKLQYLYKIVNTLKKRWHEDEIPETFKVLKIEILSLNGTIFYVPPSFPATSGWYADVPRFSWTHFAEPVSLGFAHGSIFARFRSISETRAPARKIIYEDVYLWDALRSAQDECKILASAYEKSSYVLTHRQFKSVTRRWLRDGGAQVFLKSVQSVGQGYSLELNEHGQMVKGSTSYFLRKEKKGGERLYHLHEATHQSGKARVGYNHVSTWM